MNNNRYRLVFNKTSGLLMAVAECVNGMHKSAAGERRGTPSGRALAMAPPAADRLDGAGCAGDGAGKRRADRAGQRRRARPRHGRGAQRHADGQRQYALRGWRVA
ncbi:ESPR-type extended signal peptide-containing protein [Cupriavidus basilensis]